MYFQLYICIFAIVGLVFWSMHKKTALDVYRNKMFRLRDEVREYFIKHGLELNSREYKAMRGLVNSYIANVEELSFSQVTYFMSELKKDPMLEAHLVEKLDKMFSRCDDETKAYIVDVRQRASQICQFYLIERSGLAFSFCITVMCFYVPWVFVLKPLIEYVRPERWRDIVRRALATGAESVGVIDRESWDSLKIKIARRIVDDRRVEETSYALSRKNECIV